MPNSLGSLGETIGVQFLKQKGFEIEAFNWRLGKSGEIDIIAFDKQSKALVFVEVKTRRNGFEGAGEAAISYGKRKQLIKLAEAYLSQREEGLSEGGCRFDVLVIHFQGKSPANITHYMHAFDES